MRRRMRAVIPGWDWSSIDGYWMHRLILEPLMSAADGDLAPLRAGLEELAAAPPHILAGRPRALARFALGREEAAVFGTLVYRAEQEAWLAIGLALRAELRGDDADRTAAWGAFLDLPLLRRLTGDLLPHGSLDLLARWRGGRLHAEDLR